MYALNFEYDGKLLSDYGFMICFIDGSLGVNNVETGYNISFEKVKRNGGRNYGLISTSYEDCVQATFHICKRPDMWDDQEITNDEYRNLVRWLNRHEFLKFRVFNEFEHDDAPCYFFASFNIGKIYIRDILYGLELTVTTNSPYGYGAQIEKLWEIPNAGGTVELYDVSDDAGYICPDMEITCRSSGDLIIENELLDSRMSISNCVSGETIKVHGDTKILESSNGAHKIYNDFNYEFLKIGNTFHERNNIIKFSMPCLCKLTYSPIIKDIP